MYTHGWDQMFYFIKTSAHIFRIRYKLNGELNKKLEEYMCVDWNGNICRLNEENFQILYRIIIESTIREKIVQCRIKWQLLRDYVYIQLL